MSQEEQKETEVRNIFNKTPEGSTNNIKCHGKCVHDGLGVCYHTEKEIITKIPKEESATDTSRSGDTDSVRSGESAFKTFHFDTQENDPDMEKCLNFWKNVLEKNIKPMKCTLLKPNKIKETVSKKKKNNVEVCQKEETKQLWIDVYKELQRKRLDKIKLGKQKTCESCSDFFDHEYEKKQDSEDIKKLNQWKSHRQTPKLDVKAQVKRTLQVLKAARGGSSDKIVDTKNKQLSEKIKSPSKTSTTGGVTEDVPKIQQSHTDPVVLEVQQSSETSFQKSPIAEKSVVLPESTPKKSDATKYSVASSEAVTGSKISDDIQPPGDPRTGKFEENIKKPTEIVGERRKSNNEKTENVIREDESDICCKCGCEVDQCICGEMENLGIEIASCIPCDCQSVCVCNNDIPDKDICSCACSIEQCICEQKDPCICGCGLEECTCENLNVCTCECGLDECICQQLFTKMCKCGDQNCDCDMIEILSTYLDTARTPTRAQSQTGFVSTESQTDNQDELWEKPPKQGGYCIICGHFNCNCNRENYEYCDD